ncbi:Ankyrin repeat protein 1 [Giardia muris]|uniref:Ankyrin repeat protein 1 n=1 Tax=Giardia muris TaxID=5742 RepID=A0A4Z1TC43_GIAMU|nr:Ankyrin repeat protein 1 [Giardia muris]|eukprot:TNJ30129.1 Ankyrin repeat protein 1 [Giardia muris]
MSIERWFAAATQCRLDVLRQLSSAFLGSVDERGRSALIRVVRGGSVECTRFLMGYEASLTLPSGWTALMEAAYMGQTEIAAILASDLTGKCLLTMEGTYPPGTTALIVAATEGHTDMVRLLYEYEADCSRWTQSFLDLFLGLDDIAASSKDAVGRTPLMYLAMHSHRGLFHPELQYREVLKQSAGIFDDTGFTALMYAVTKGNVDFIAYSLNEQTKDLCLISPTGQQLSALMLAAQLGLVDICETLAASEACLTNPCGICALMIAILIGHEDIVLLLVPYEVHIQIVRSCIYVYELSAGMRPIDIALRYGTPTIASLLSQTKAPFSERSIGEPDSAVVDVAIGSPINLTTSMTMTEALDVPTSSMELQVERLTLDNTRLQEYSRRMYEQNQDLVQRLREVQSTLVILRDERQRLGAYVEDSAELIATSLASSGADTEDSMATLTELVQRFTRFYLDTIAFLRENDEKVVVGKNVDDIADIMSMFFTSVGLNLSHQDSTKVTHDGQA